jgi:hypothetical protein
MLVPYRNLTSVLMRKLWVLYGPSTEVYVNKLGEAFGTYPRGFLVGMVRSLLVREPPEVLQRRCFKCSSKIAVHSLHS